LHSCSFLILNVYVVNIQLGIATTPFKTLA
jgi:hypothetical protein